jgi:hypothetical protein
MVFLPKKMLAPYLDVLAVEGLCRKRGSSDFTTCKKDIVKEFEKTYASWKDNPRGVIDRLGKLVLVGDVISATNRITVTSGPVPGPIAAPPAIFSATLDHVVLGDVPQGKKKGVLEIVGSHLKGAQITSTSDKIVIDPPTSTDGLITTFVAVADDALPGNYTLIVATPGGSLPRTIRVIHKDPPDDLVVSQYEKSDDGTKSTTPFELALGVAQDLEVTITGKNLKGANVILPIALGAPLAVENSSDTTLVVSLRIPANAPRQKYTMKITNSSGGSETVEFEIKAPG